MLKSKGQYEAFMKKRKFENKLAQKERERRMLYDEHLQLLKKLPLDYSIYSTEDEELSDYELEERDLYPDGYPQKK